MTSRSPNSGKYRTTPSSNSDEELWNCFVSIHAGKRKLLKLGTKSPKILFFIALFSASFILSYDDTIFDNIIASFMSTSRYDGLNMNGVDRHTRQLMAVKADYENQIITSAKRMKNGRHNKEIDNAVRRVRWVNMCRCCETKVKTHITLIDPLLSWQLSKALKIAWPICNENKSKNSHKIISSLPCNYIYLRCGYF